MVCIFLYTLTLHSSYGFAEAAILFIGWGIGVIFLINFVLILVTSFFYFKLTKLITKTYFRPKVIIYSSIILTVLFLAFQVFTQ